MNKTLAILGAGDLGRQVAHMAFSDNHYNKIVFFDDYSHNSCCNEWPILGKTQDVIASFKKKDFDELIIAIGYHHLNVKNKIYETFLGVVPFGKVIHSSAWIDSSAFLDDGIVVYPRAVIDQNVRISGNSIINLSVTISHDTDIEQSCFLSPGVVVAGNVKIGKCSFLGVNATIKNGLVLSEKVTVGAGSLVIKNLVSPGIYYGSPAKLIK